LHVGLALKTLRARSRRLFGRLLARLIAQRPSSSALIAADVASVLVCRINGRLGNAVFLTPLVKCIHELLPHATIDLALAYPRAGELLENVPGIRRVIAFPHKGPRLVRRYLGALRQLRAERYDVVIDPIPESTGGRAVLTMCRARYRIGFALDSQWAPLTHAVPLPKRALHQAVEPVFLLCHAFGVPYDPHDLKLSLSLRSEEMEVGRSAIRDAIGRGMSTIAAVDGPMPHTLGFFAHATGLKMIERPWWLAFWKAFLELEPDAIPVEFLPTPHSTPTDARFPSLHLPSPRNLTAAIAATRMFLSADTGPMHLASSTSVPTVALFRASDPALYGPLKAQDVVIDITQCTPPFVAQRCRRIWLETIYAAAR
jgi:ADP-heptose:LPS heptosyltransferase